MGHFDAPLLDKQTVLSLFSGRLREARKLAGLSQQATADLAGISLTQYHAYEHARAEPGATIVCNLAQVLNVTCDWLLGKSPELLELRLERLRGLSPILRQVADLIGE